MAYYCSRALICHDLFEFGKHALQLPGSFYQCLLFCSDIGSHLLCGAACGLRRLPHGRSGCIQCLSRTLILFILLPAQLPAYVLLHQGILADGGVLQSRISQKYVVFRQQQCLVIISKLQQGVPFHPVHAIGEKCRKLGPAVLYRLHSAVCVTCGSHQLPDGVMVCLLRHLLQSLCDHLILPDGSCRRGCSGSLQFIQLFSCLFLHAACDTARDPDRLLHARRGAFPAKYRYGRQLQSPHLFLAEDPSLRPGAFPFFRAFRAGREVIRCGRDCPPCRLCRSVYLWSSCIFLCQLIPGLCQSVVVLIMPAEYPFSVFCLSVGLPFIRFSPDLHLLLVNSGKAALHHLFSVGDPRPVGAEELCKAASFIVQLLLGQIIIIIPGLDRFFSP